MSKKITRCIVLALIFTLSLLIYLYVPRYQLQSSAKDRLRVLDYVQESLNAIYKNDDPTSLVRRISIHKYVWEAYYLHNASQFLSQDDDELVRKSIAFQEEIYPFNKKYFRSVWDLYSSYSGRGIVITTGNWYTK